MTTRAIQKTRLFRVEFKRYSYPSLGSKSITLPGPPAVVQPAFRGEVPCGNRANRPLPRALRAAPVRTRHVRARFHGRRRADGGFPRVPITTQLPEFLYAYDWCGCPDVGLDVVPMLFVKLPVFPLKSAGFEEPKQGAQKCNEARVFGFGQLHCNHCRILKEVGISPALILSRTFIPESGFHL